MSIWIEIRQERHTLGNDDRDDWSYGKVLWSPTTNKAGSKIYELMKRPIKGDRVLHFYETGGVRYYHAHSKVIKSYDISYETPTDPGTWSWAKEFYRIEIGEFSLINDPIDVNYFTEIHDTPLRQEILEDTPENYPFQIKRYKDPKWKKDSQVTLKQGKYLQECTNKLFTLLQECSEIEASNQNENKSGSQSEYAEGKRKERETYFFARNPKLIREAKRTHGYKCQACGFEFKDKYGDFGKDYIECHHENVLSERPEEEWSNEVKTSVDDIKVLCSNCHRMIHHKRPALSFDELLELLEKKN
jgi:predicted HNH restriction endonuclease